MEQHAPVLAFAKDMFHISSRAWSTCNPLKLSLPTKLTLDALALSLTTAGPAPTVEWSKALSLTASCLSPLHGLPQQ